MEIGLNTDKRFVYFIQMGEDGPIKIGITDNIEKRIISLQTGNPYKLKILYTKEMVADLAEVEEKHLHDVFKRIRLNGEWFRPVPFLLKRINQMRTEGFYSIPEYHWDYEKSATHNGVWNEIDTHWEAIFQAATKYKIAGDVESYRYIIFEVQDLLNSI